MIEAPGMDQLLPRTVFPPPIVIQRDVDSKAVRYEKAPKGRSYFLMSTWAHSGGENGPRRLIQVAMDETGERAVIAIYRRDTLLALFLGTLIFAVLGVFIARRCLRPVGDLARHANHAYESMRFSTFQCRSLELSASDAATSVILDPI